MRQTAPRPQRFGRCGFGALTRLRHRHRGLRTRARQVVQNSASPEHQPTWRAAALTVIRMDGDGAMDLRSTLTELCYDGACLGRATNGVEVAGR